MATNQAANARNEQIRMARARREELQPIIDKLSKARDYFDVDEQMVRDFSRASNQLTAQAASTGMTNAGTGGLDANRADLLGSMLAQLAQFKTQDDMQRTEMLAKILSDPDLQVGELQEGDVAGQTLLASILGGFTGAASNLNSYMSTPDGLAALQGYFTPKAAPATDPASLSGIFGAGGNMQPVRQIPLGITPWAQLMPYAPRGGGQATGGRGGLTAAPW